MKAQIPEGWIRTNHEVEEILHNEAKRRARAMGVTVGVVYNLALEFYFDHHHLREAKNGKPKRR